MYREEVRLGLIGAGRWGRCYIETIKSIGGVNLEVVASRNPETGALVPGKRVVSDWRELLNVDLDGVIIASPPASHGKIVRAFATEGIPVMVEKPLCLNLAEAYDLKALVETKEIPVMVDHTQLFHPAYKVLKDCAKDLGKVRFIRSEGMAFGPFRPDVPVLWDWAPHDISLCLDLLAKIPDRVSALGNRSTVTLWLDFSDGSFAWISNSNVSQKKRRVLTVYFDHHILVLDDLAANKLVKFEVDFTSLYDSSPTIDSGTALAAPDGMPLIHAVKYFVQGIRGGDLTGFGLDFACDVIRTIDAAQHSIDNGHPCSL